MFRRAFGIGDNEGRPISGSTATAGAGRESRLNQFSADEGSPKAGLVLFPADSGGDKEGEVKPT